MLNDRINEELLRTMFKVIRNAEIKNVKTKKQDDKGMARIIEDYIYKKVITEVKEEDED